MAHLPNSYTFGVSLGQFQDITCANLAFFQDAQVKSDTATSQKYPKKLGHSHLDPELEARDARLGHFDQRATHAKHVADVNLILQHSLDGEILPELPESEISSTELALPVVIVLYRVYVGRFIDAAVTYGIRLLVPVEVQRPKHDPAAHRFLEDTR